MKYHLICQGHLLVGAKKKESIAHIQRITKLSEEKVRHSLLNGKPRTLFSSSDQDKVKKFGQALRTAGLDVQIQSDSKKPSKKKSPPIQPRSGLSRKKGLKKTKRMHMQPQAKKSCWSRCFTTLLLLFLLFAGAAGYGWHWLYRRPLPTPTLTAEQALFDGNVVLTGLVDVDKLVTLERFWFGKLDLKTLPLDEEQQGVLADLFLGTAKLRDNLQQIFYSLSIHPEQQSGQHMLVLAGTFDVKSLLDSLAKGYQLQQISSNRWQLRQQKKTDPQRGYTKEPEAGNDFYLHLTENWILLFQDQVHGDHILTRLSTQQPAEQETGQWQNYRQGRLISFMALKPTQAGTALGGMMAQGITSKAPQVSTVAVGLGLHPLRGGLHANVQLASQDIAWNDSTKDRIEQGVVAQLSQDSRAAISPTLARVLSRLQTTSTSDSLELDIRLNTQLLNNMSQVVREGLRTLLAGGLSLGDTGEMMQEELNEQPKSYPVR